MDQLFDTLARILATPMSRRKAVGLAGSALAAAVVAALGVTPAHAEAPPPEDRRCTRQQRRSGFKTCRPNGRDGDDDDRDDDDERGDGGDAICCPPGTCCANGRGRTECCQRGQCVCSNGKCAASNGGRCPSGCHRCNG